MAFDSYPDFSIYDPLERDVRSTEVSASGGMHNPDFADMMRGFYRTKNITTAPVKTRSLAFNPHAVARALPTHEIELPDRSAVSCTQLTRQECDGLRREFVTAAYEGIYSNCNGAYSRKQLRALLSSYHLHHKLPVNLGGTNDYENLVLIDPDVHAAIHRIIDLKMTKIRGLQRKYATRGPSGLSRLMSGLAEIDGVRCRGDGHIILNIPFPDGAVFAPAASLQKLCRNRFRVPHRKGGRQIASLVM